MRSESEEGVALCVVSQGRAWRCESEEGVALCVVSQ